MASTDIDGSTIVILSEAEAHRVYDVLCGLIDAYQLAAADADAPNIVPLDYNIVNKIARDLKLPPLE